MAQALQGWVHSISNATFLPLAMKRLLSQGYAMVAQPYLDSTEGRRICWKIIAFNTAIWFAWQLPRLRGVMNTSFMHHPLSGLSYTLLTAVFRCVSPGIYEMGYLSSEQSPILFPFTTELDGTVELWCDSFYQRSFEFC
jgi:hypothetical protein